MYLWLFVVAQETCSKLREKNCELPWRQYCDLPVLLKEVCADGISGLLSTSASRLYKNLDLLHSEMSGVWIRQWNEWTDIYHTFFSVLIRTETFAFHLFFGGLDPPTVSESDVYNP